MRGGARRGHKKSHSASPHKKGYSPYLTHGAAALGGVGATLAANAAYSKYNKAYLHRMKEADIPSTHQASLMGFTTAKK